MVRQSEEQRAIFTVNVSADRLQAVFERLSFYVDAPGFLVLETGTNQTVERTLRKNDQDPFHVDLHILDQLSHPQLLELLASDRELFYEDGQVNFGFASQAGVDEVFIGAYKVLEIYTHWPEKYLPVLGELGFEQEAKLRTIWDNISIKTPASRSALKDLPRTIWTLLEELRGRGLQLADRRAVCSRGPSTGL